MKKVKVNLRTCPFCNGSDFKIVCYLSEGWIQCLECEAQGPHSHKIALTAADLEKAEEEASTLWNTRNRFIRSHVTFPPLNRIPL